VHDGYLLARQLAVRVEFGDGRVIPRRDVAKIDIRQYLTRELQLAIRFEVIRGDHGAAHGGNVRRVAPGLLLLFIAHRLVGSSEGHRLPDELLPTTAGADGLVVDLYALFLRELLQDRRVERGRERSSRAGDLLGRFYRSTPGTAFITAPTFLRRTLLRRSAPDQGKGERQTHSQQLPTRSSTQIVSSLIPSCRTAPGP
jgi:hypothetical protein